MKSHVVLGSVGALFLCGALYAVTGGRGISQQGTFLQSGTGATLRTIESKLRDTVSVCDYIGPVCPSGGDDTAAIQAALTNTLGTVWVPPGTYKVSATLTTAAGAYLLRCAGMDSAILQFTNAGDGLQLNGWNVEDCGIQTTNAAAGIGLRFSSLNQTIKNVKISNSGSGRWSIGIQNLGAVTTTLQNSYTTATCCTIGIEAVPNSGFAVGNFVLQDAEVRAVTTGFHIGGATGALSIAIFGGAFEGAASAGILADGGGAHSLSIYGTHFESNTTDDIKWVTGGDLSIFEGNFVTGTTNIINCPNTTCTPRMRLYGVIGNASGHVILGDSIRASSLFGCEIAGSLLTLGKPGNVMRWGNSSLDGTVINNVVADDGGGPGRMFLQGGAGTNQAQISSNTDGKLYALHNGIQGWIIDANGKFQIVTGALPDGGGMKHKRVAVGCTTAAAIGANCTSAALAWTTAFADANYTIACTLTGPTGQPHISSVAQIAASFTVTIAADTAVAATGTVDCIALHD